MPTMPKPKILKVRVPSINEAQYPVTRITVEYPDGQTQRMEFVSGPASEREFKLPHYIRPNQCAVYMQMCSQGGVLAPMARAITLQEMPQRQPTPEE